MLALGDHAPVGDDDPALAALADAGDLAEAGDDRAGRHGERAAVAGDHRAFGAGPIDRPVVDRALHARPRDRLRLDRAGQVVAGPRHQALEPLEPLVDGADILAARPLVLVD